MCHASDLDYIHLPLLQEIIDSFDELPLIEVEEIDAEELPPYWWLAMPSE